jgi:putative colanic acid polymerase
MLTTILTFATVILLHFQLFMIAGYPLTGGAVCGVALFFLTARRIRFQPLIVGGGLLVLAVPLAIFLVQEGVAGAEFVRTWLLLILAVAILFSACQFDYDRRAILKGLEWSLIAVSGFAILQWSLWVVLDYGSLFNPFRSHQYLYQYRYWLYESNPRAAGFYLEPSFLGIVVSMLLAGLSLGDRLSTKLALLGVAALGCAGSITGFVIAAIVLGSRYASTRWRARPGISIALAVVVFALGLGLVQDQRLQSVFIAGTSANYRVVAPLPLLGDTLTEYPLGRSLGSIDEVVDSYGIAHSAGSGAGRTLDNGVYVLVVYFGVGFIVFMGVSASVVLVGPRDSGRRLLFFVLTVAAAGTGAVFNPEFVLLVALTISVYRYQDVPKLSPLADRGGAR